MTESGKVTSEYAAEKHAIGSIFGCAGLVGVVALILILFADDLMGAIALYFLIVFQARIARKTLALTNRAQELYEARRQR